MQWLDSRASNHLGLDDPFHEADRLTDDLHYWWLAMNTLITINYLPFPQCSFRFQPELLFCVVEAEEPPYAFVWQQPLHLLYLNF